MSRDTLFCLCCCTSFGGGNRPGARREARLLRREEAISHGYEQRAADSKHDLRVPSFFAATRGLTKAASRSFYGVATLLASPPGGQYESVVAVHEAAFAIYGFRKKKTYV